MGHYVKYQILPNVNLILGTTIAHHSTKHLKNISGLIEFLFTCKSKRSSAHITARRQSMRSSKGKRHPLLSNTGTHPAANASKKR